MNAGTTAELGNVSNISVKMPASRSAHSQSTQPGMLSGPATFRGFTLQSCDLLNGKTEYLFVGGGGHLTP